MNVERGAELGRSREIEKLKRKLLQIKKNQVEKKLKTFIFRTFYKHVAVNKISGVYSIANQ